MRYYNITVAGAPAGIFPARYENGAQWGTITQGGQHDPNAQQIEFQIQEWDPSTLAENCVLTIYGVSWEQVKNSNQLVGKPITVLGGMSPGLPLATFQSQRDKLLLQGKILKCWGNWIGNETSIGMAFVAAGASAAEGGDGGGGGGGGGDGGGGGASVPGAGTPLMLGDARKVRLDRTGFRSIDRRSRPVGRALIPLGVDPLQFLQQVGGQLVSEFDIGAATSTIGGITSSFFGGGNVSPLSEPLNLIHNMMPNIPLTSAMQETLSKAFPNANINMLISSALKLPYQDAGIYQAVEQYIGYINKLSQSILGTNRYSGVHLSSYDNTINVWDGTRPVSNDSVDYLDLIGQPTWLTVNTISIKVVLRGGLHVGSLVTLPQTIVGFNGADSQAPGGGGAVPDQRTHVSLPGTYWITKILHIGDFRNPDGASWSTNYEASTSYSMVGAAPTSDQVDSSNQQQAPKEKVFEPVIKFRN
jgi:hypothetical protein